MKKVTPILAVLAIILALVAISTWIDPYVSAAIICGSAIGAIVAACIKLEKKEL